MNINLAVLPRTRPARSTPAPAPSPVAWPAAGRPPAPPAHRTARLALVALNLAVVASFLLTFSRHGVGFGRYRIDLDVYRIGSRVWQHGGDLYGALPPTASGARLPFSYPPVASVLLSPLSLVPMTVAGTALTLATVAACALVLRTFLRSCLGPRAGSWPAVAWLLPAALLLEPVRNTIGYGQVNVLLMALVTADCLVPAPPWPRGALVGLAAAVKLTPAAFVLFFLLRRDRRAAATAAASFCAATAAGFALAGGDSLRYWTSVVFQSGRPGSPAYAANQSVTAVLARAGLPPGSAAGRGAWLAASALVVLVACLAMRRALAPDRGGDEPGHQPGAGTGGRPGRDAWALSLNALAALLVSPISWSHHWVWGEAAMLVLACRGLREPRPARRWPPLAAAATGTALLALSPQWWFPSTGDQELHWAWWQQIAGSSYVILALAILLAAAVGRASENRSPPTR